MKIHFFKYQGAGNDFILVDNRNNSVNYQQKGLIARLCDRRFGIGGDGIMFLQHSIGYDFEMVYFNSDGNPSSMCGNGGRCIVAFAKKLDVIGTETDFLAVDGPHHAKISAEGNWVKLQMIDVDSIAKDGDALVLDTGSPHYIKMVENVASTDVFNEGRAIRNNETYHSKGINVNFVEDLGDRYSLRTYERGVEDETFACGTGATAVALAMAYRKGQYGHIETPIKVMGGDLNISFDREEEHFSNVFLEGPATFVFEGDIEI